MKKTLIFLALTVCVFLSSCGDDAWDYDHSLEHVYFYGLCNEAYPGGNEFGALLHAPIARRFTTIRLPYPIRMMRMIMMNRSWYAEQTMWW